MSFFSKKPAMYKHRVVSQPLSNGKGRQWIVQYFDRIWCFEDLTLDETIGREWVENMRTHGTHMRVEFQC